MASAPTLAREIGPEWGVDDRGLTRTAVFADINQDGALDLVTWQLVEGARICLHQGSRNAWLVVQPRLADGENRFALGARVDAWADDKFVTMQQVECGSNGLSSSGPPEVHLGLGDLETVDLFVAWPDGGETWSRGVPTRNPIRITR